MSRMPTPGGDDGDWGNILNDFLQVEHNANGTLKKAALITGAEQATNKGIANGYASLDSNGIVPVSQLPNAFVGSGDYLGLTASTQVISSGNSAVVWESITASVGTSATWSAGQPDTVTVNADGVYAISLTIDWGDSGDTSGSYRHSVIYVNCGFYTQDQRPSVIDGGNVTIQSVQFTARLQAGDQISIDAGHGSASPLTPYALLLVTCIVPTYPAPI